MTNWQEGPPQVPGWYVLHYSGGRYEAVRLTEGSNIFTVPNPEQWGIRRYFEFQTMPPSTVSAEVLPK